MVNMKMSAEESAEQAPGLAAPDQREYPYGLEISLDDESMAKLGVTKLPDVGYVMKVTALVTVTSVRSNQTQGSEPEQGMTLQITDMQLDAPARNDAQIAATLWPKQ